MEHLAEWVRQEVEPFGCRVMSDDGMTVLRDQYSDGYVVTVLCHDFIYGFVLINVKHTEESVRRDARELGRFLESYFKQEGYDENAGQPS